MEGQTKPHWTFPPELLTPDRQGHFQDFFVGSRMLDLMEKRESEWRIKHRKIAYDWFRVVEGQSWSADYPFAGYEHFHFGSSEPEDVGAKFFEGAFDL
jgi:hypothetical protein